MDDRQAVAEGFARGHRGITVPDAVVAEYRITKPDIITVMPDMAESEVIIDPRVPDFRPTFIIFP
jgi:hypothetical protein